MGGSRPWPRVEPRSDQARLISMPAWGRGGSRWMPGEAKWPS